MTTQYLIRLDDACPTMQAANWARIEAILDKYEIKPMVGVIPNNKDPKQELAEPNPNFWILVKSWQDKGWAIALHGYDHQYISNEAGINPFWNRSEFAGISLDKQKEKIRKGIRIFNDHGCRPKYFFAPSHTFDENTLEALRQESDIRIISDTIGRKPYKRGDFVFIPQVVGHCSDFPVSGIWTFCLHPNTMTDENMATTELFISKNVEKFIGFDDIDLNKISHKTLYDQFLSWLFFSYRKLRGLK